MFKLIKHPFNHIEKHNIPSTKIDGKIGAIVFNKLKKFLAVKKYTLGYIFGSSSIYQSGTYIFVSWQPRLKEGYKRLTYKDFIDFYEIKH
jgi:hypothetical protein